MSKHVVATVDEIPPGERKIVEIGGRSLGIFNIKGDFYALRNICPHQGGPLCQGRLTGFLMADKPGGEYRYERRGEILRCPWHGWEYDVTTGQSWVDPASVRTRSYDVEVAPADALPKAISRDRTRPRHSKFRSTASMSSWSCRVDGRSENRPFPTLSNLRTAPRGKCPLHLRVTERIYS